MLYGAANGVAAASINVWSIDSGPIDTQPYFGETMANGMIGIASTRIPFRTERTQIYGAYEAMWPGSVSNVARMFDFLGLSFYIDGARIDQVSQTRHFHQTLDMKDAVLTTFFDYQDKASIQYTIRALRQLPHTALMEVVVVAKRPVHLAVKSLMSVPSATGAVSWLKHPAFSWLIHVRRFDSEVVTKGVIPRRVVLAAASAKGPDGRLSIAAAQSFMFDEGVGAAPLVTGKQGILSFNRPVVPGANLHFALVGAAITSAHVSDPLNEARRLTTAAVIEGTPSLIEKHAKAWADLWTSDILVAGDEATQRDVHGMIYHLYSSIRENSGYSIPPMGLSGGPSDYSGHIFWDAETWILPALLALKPELARTMLDYRYERLAAARNNAAMNGYRGAQFPWESAASGDEDTWSEASTGALEIHVSADVALAAWNYYQVTQDKRWLQERGFPLISETAAFWVSRVSRRAPGHYDIDHVVAADEDAENVDNDAYTNAAARENLAAAIAASKVLGIAPDPAWEEVRENIPILKFADGVDREYANYDGGRIWQADVNLLSYPLHAVAEPEDIRRDLDYYAGRVDEANGPAMTKSIFAILSQRLGMSDKAYRFFKSAYTPNLRPPFGGLAESPDSANPYFVTGAGGLLQTMIYGFGGLQIGDHGFIRQPTTLPSNWKSIALPGIEMRGQTTTAQ